jgi:hypothetical protein
LFNTTMQRQVPGHALSRVTSYTWFGSLIAYPLGLAMAGPLVSVFAIRRVLLVDGTLLILAILPLLAVPDIWRLTDESPALTVPAVPVPGD